ncbi:histidinol-phosphate transaminase [Agreia sp. VKM Ac-1783]|uniref:histidinol-phosphate transaminase n=1 Tax=Agreia sp. VKM Ac-1783 TaxID=1938889 RepID=UPI000A2ACC6B|nr:histidinol-phosphate transaminase [Agreia sp. VKM Ac-1783]SMQ74937.1 histidinol-phosphate aminotransferase [Agreia sp. VKM Ac-1783]
MSDSSIPPVKLRPEILALPPYKQGTSIEGGFKLSSNENPFPPLPGVLEAVQQASASLNRYPNAAAPDLTAKLAERFGVSADEVIIGAGSVSLLVQLVQAAAGAADEVVYSWRSFEAYPWMPTLTGAVSVKVPNTDDHRHDLPAMLDAITERTRLIIVCSPNNPTGTIVTQTEFEEFMDAVPSDLLVILDEAYAEFVTDEDAVDGAALLGHYPNLVVLRTFSKAYGLAGLRVGYGIGPAAILQAARTTAIPLGITDQAQHAAVVSLGDETELEQRVSDIAERRDTLWAALIDQGWDAPKPQGNFIWLPTGEHTAHAAVVYAENGIVVRAFHPEGVRISIGEHESVEKLIAISAKLVATLSEGPSTHPIA